MPLLTLFLLRLLTQMLTRIYYVGGVFGSLRLGGVGNVGDVWGTRGWGVRREGGRG